MAETLDIHPFILSRWRKEYREVKFAMKQVRKAPAEAKQKVQEQDEVARLKRPYRSFRRMQMIGYGVWFSVLTAVGFGLIGVFASQLSEWLRKKPKLVLGLNIGAGVTFISSGLVVAFMKQR
ncbi:hypothetical protein ACGTN6_20390 [Halomonas sp. THAF12]|uniref:hypothetical protein n=1 Tax=Halomonas sp. B23F22_10 TaxID=3459515 RepID=UPI00373FA2E3